MIKFKSNILSFAALFILLSCMSSQTKLQNQHVTVTSMDTVTNDSMLVALTRLSFEKREVTISQRYNKVTRVYLGMGLEDGLQDIQKTVSFHRDLCDGEELMFQASFKGDSIDNPEGYEFKTVHSGDTSYYFLSASFKGCNGSFCNNGAILVLKYINDSLLCAAYFGFDRSLIEFKSIEAHLRQNALQVFIKSARCDKPLELWINGSITIKDYKGSISELGLACIE